MQNFDSFEIFKLIYEINHLASTYGDLVALEKALRILLVHRIQLWSFSWNSWKEKTKTFSVYSLSVEPKDLQQMFVKTTNLTRALGFNVSIN